MVITGAASGIGLATAKMAARRGAKVVLVARSRDDLEKAVNDIKSEGGEAMYIVADVADKMAIQHVADTTIEAYGRFDTWVNNAGISIFGRLTETDMEEKRRLFDVNFWGVVHGCRAAVPHLWEHGGAIINIGSIVSERAIPLQGIYSASKAAVKNYTDSLRMELEEENSPISVTLIKPATIATPYFENARSKMDRLPHAPPPVYHPEVVAEAILHCAEHPMREVTVGGFGKFMTLMGKFFPRLTDLYMENGMFESQKSDQPVSAREDDNLYSPVTTGAREEGHYEGHVMHSSAFTRSRLHPFVTTSLLAGLGAGIALLAMGGGRRVSALARQAREDFSNRLQEQRSRLVGDTSREEAPSEVSARRDRATRDWAA